MRKDRVRWLRKAWSEVVDAHRSGTKSSFCMRMFKWQHGFSINGNATWGNTGLFQESWMLNYIMLLKAFNSSMPYFVSTCMCVFLFTGALNGSGANFYPLNWYFFFNDGVDEFLYVRISIIWRYSRHCACSRWDEMLLFWIDYTRPNVQCENLKHTK